MSPTGVLVAAYAALMLLVGYPTVGAGDDAFRLVVLVAGVSLLTHLVARLLARILPRRSDAFRGGALGAGLGAVLSVSGLGLVIGCADSMFRSSEAPDLCKPFSSPALLAGPYLAFCDIFGLVLGGVVLTAGLGAVGALAGSRLGDAAGDKQPTGGPGGAFPKASSPRSSSGRGLARPGRALASGYLTFALLVGWSAAAGERLRFLALVAGIAGLLLVSEHVLLRAFPLRSAAFRCGALGSLLGAALSASGSTLIGRCNQPVNASSELPSMCRSPALTSGLGMPLAVVSHLFADAYALGVLVLIVGLSGLGAYAGRRFGDAAGENAPR